VLKIFAFGVEQQPERGRAKCARILDKDVNRAGDGGRFSGNGVNGIFVANIGRDAVGFATSTPDLIDRVV
jgi:hypothetical protein